MSFFKKEYKSVPESSLEAKALDAKAQELFEACMAELLTVTSTSTRLRPVIQEKYSTLRAENFNAIVDKMNTSKGELEAIDISSRMGASI